MFNEWYSYQNFPNHKLKFIAGFFTPYGDKVWVDFGNGMFPGGTKPLLGLVLTYSQLGSVVLS